MIATIQKIRRERPDNIAILSEMQDVSMSFSVPEGRFNWALSYMNIGSRQKLIGREIAFVGQKYVEVYLLFDLEAEIDSKSSALNGKMEILGDINEVVEEGATTLYIETPIDDLYLEFKAPAITLEKTKLFLHCKYLSGQIGFYSPITGKVYACFRIK